MKFKRSMGGVALLATTLLLATNGNCAEAAQSAAAWPGGFPGDLPAPVVSGNMPLAVPQYSTTDPEAARPYFDYFTWQSFIALMWPADTSAQRGTPLQPANPEVLYTQGPGYPLVWRQYKEYFELLGTGADRPTEWSSYAVPASAQLCQNDAGTGSKPLNTLNVINQAMSVPLIDQYQEYTFSEVRFNDAQYSFIRGADNNSKSWLYLKKNLPSPYTVVNMPVSTTTPPQVGSIMVKGTWRVMTDAEMQDPNISGRYYIVNAYITDNGTSTCSLKPMGLVGFHISAKLQDFPQWIWATVAQVDNLQPAHGAPATMKAPFNNGTNVPATPKGWANKPAEQVPPLVAKKDRVPAQITQFNPTPGSTEQMNAVYQKLLEGTPLAYYEVLITQYPFTPQFFKTIEAGGIYPRDSGGAWPVDGAVNPVMESYLQSNEDASGNQGNSCMKCHYEAGNTDYSWLLKTGSH